MSGPNEVLSQNRGRAFQLRVKHTNEKGGVLGRAVEPVVEDDKSNIATRRCTSRRRGSCKAGVRGGAAVNG
jgi:ABC-type branched-subunit amino acid transport system substrate-binding protein